uniref:Arf-GAP with GTPase, ANK repeat and PH domain-containing protein 3 n=1 Tax=Schistosoma haematobium TaxID=6185 RepID=A0A095BYT3_SCHHA
MRVILTNCKGCDLKFERSDALTSESNFWYRQIYELSNGGGFTIMSSQSSLNDISNAIRQEIIRFESVHPNIYAVYDLIDAVEDKNLAESLRQLVVSIEGTVSFVNQTFRLLDAFVNS